MKERQGDDAQHIEVEKKQLVYHAKGKKSFKLCTTHLSDEAFLHYIGKEEADQGAES